MRPVAQASSQHHTTMQAPRRRRGAAAVEMAMVAPLMFLLIFGMIEFGRAIMVANVLTVAAREGARAIVVPNGTTSELTTAVNKELTAAQIDTTKVTIKVYVNDVQKDASQAITGDVIKVEVLVPYKDVTWLPTQLLLSKATSVAGSAVMRHE